jgi:hypothetical protein
MTSCDRRASAPVSSYRKDLTVERILWTTTLVLLTIGSPAAQRKPIANEQSAARQVHVTAQMIARDKAYTLDLDRSGTVYTLAPDVDYDRVRVRTAKGEMPLTDLVGTPRTKARVLVGWVNDLRTFKPGRAPRGAVAKDNYTCEGLRCECTGDVDCNEMFSADVCGDIASCNADSGKCACIKKL